MTNVRKNMIKRKMYTQFTVKFCSADLDANNAIDRNEIESKKMNKRKHRQHD